MGQSSSSIPIFTSYGHGVPLGIFSCPVESHSPPSSGHGEALLIHKVSCNQNCRPVPAAALKELLEFVAQKDPEFGSQWGVSVTPDDPDTAPFTGFVFVSKNNYGLESLHVALRSFNGKVIGELRLTDMYGADTLGGSGMVSSGCIAGGFNVGGRAIGHSLVYVSTTKVDERTSAAVYKTNLADGKTERLTPPGQYDLSPAVSPSGEMVAVANLRWNKSTGDMENLKTDIVIMNVERKAQGGLRRKIVIHDGGWPTWGSDNIIFFHRAPKHGTTRSTLGMFRAVQSTWGVFRYDLAANQAIRVTPEAFDAVTPAAISETKVAVATIRKKSGKTDGRSVDAQYRHIEIFDVNAGPDQPAQITQKFRPLTDHYNPFILDSGSRVGYYCKENDVKIKSIDHTMIKPLQDMNSTAALKSTSSTKMPREEISTLTPPSPRQGSGVQPLKLISQIAKKKYILEIGKAMVLMWSWLISNLWQPTTKKLKEMVEPTGWRLPNLHSWAPKWELRAKTVWPWTWSMPNLHSWAPKWEPRVWPWTNWSMPNLHSWVPKREPRAKMVWPWTWSMPKPNHYSWAFSCVTLALVLLSAIVLGRYLHDSDTPQLEQQVLPSKLETKTPLEATLRREMNITSSLSGASVEYLRNATQRYLYLAILHASVLRSRIMPGEVTLLREKVFSFETEKEILLAKHDAIVNAIDDLAGNGEALEKAMEHITKLQQELHKAVQEKKTILKSEE